MMSGHRLEAFCGEGLAIAITLLVLEIEVPALDNATVASPGVALQHRWPMLLATVLSFVAIGC